MTMVDDWAPVGERDDWAPVSPEPERIPPSFLHRLALGMMVGGAADSSPEELRQKGFEDFNIPSNVAQAFKRGLERTKKQGPMSAADALLPGFEMVTSPLSAAFQAIGGAGEKATGGLLNSEAVQDALMLSDGIPARVSRVRGGVEQVIGDLPKDADFKNAAGALAPDAAETIKSAAIRLKDGTIYSGTTHADALLAAQEARGEHVANDITSIDEKSIAGDFLTSKGRLVGRFEAEKIANAAEQTKRTEPDILGLIAENLKDLWQERGIHPAEVANDAKTDSFLRNDLTAEQKVTKLDPVDEEVLTETGGKPGSLSAAATDPPLDVPLTTEPPSVPGRLAATVNKSLDSLFDIGRDAQMLVAPMATGTRDSMALAKDFANSMRRSRWEWGRIDRDIEQRFTPEQRERMWTAADEESVMRQSGETSPHMGLATLTPEERAAVEGLQTRAQAVWLRARDIGMVEGEGLPAYTPRMIINAANATSGDAALPLNAIGHNLRVTTAQMKRRRYLTAEETETAAKAKLGAGAEIARDIRTLPLATAKLEDAIAGRTLIDRIKDYGRQTGAETVVEGGAPVGNDLLSQPSHKWFTLDHPAFKTWKPKFEEVDGKIAAAKDADGETIFQQVPLYVRGDFEGPLRAVLAQRNGALYSAAMSLKGKTMSMIMNSPLIHNAVEWGRALPAMPGKVATFKVYFEGNRAKNDVGQMREAIDNGLVPIGQRFFNQNVDDIMAQPDLTPGRSWTAKVLGFVPGLFDAKAETTVRRAIDKAGDFWHNTLLWDRVGDLQMGLYTNFRDEMVGKGIDRETAARAAAHWANRYAGALPTEAMSANARKVSNLLLFSRSFTMGNLGAMKDMLTGLPKDVLAQIERDAGFKPGAIAAAGEEEGPAQTVAQFTKAMARRKAMAIVALDVGLMYVGNSLLQNGMNVLVNDSTLEKELHDYAERFSAKLEDMKEHPLQLIQPFDFMQSISATSQNEPGKGDRVLAGHTQDGTGIYARNPAGKIGEEFQGYLTGPLDMLRRKLGTIARPAWQIMANDKGFGRKIYDPDADTPAKYLGNIGAVVSHLVKSQFPEGQIGGFADLVRGEGDAKVNALRAFGPLTGVTFSTGAPGGPAVGELFHARQQHQFAVDQAMPDIRRQILRGDVDGATDRMSDLGIPPGLQRFYLRTTQDPATRLGSRTLRDFYNYATPEQRVRMERASESPGGATPP